MKDISKTLEYNGKKYNVVFDLNVMESIQEEYGTLEKWAELTDGGDGEPNAKAVIFGFTQMLNEGIDIENEEKGYTSPEFLNTESIGKKSLFLLAKFYLPEFNIYFYGHFDIWTCS